MRVSRNASAGSAIWPFGDVTTAEDTASHRPEEADEETGQGWVVIDIGGGRGDLAINLARLLPSVSVHVVEVNTPSLVDAEKAANRLGPSVASRCSFREEDVTELFSAPSLGTGTQNVVLVGLHACGGLTDAILALARRYHVAFLCCPCCFLKFTNLRSLAHASDAASTPPPPPAGGIKPAAAICAAAGGTREWTEEEWETRWGQLARMGELTPQEGDAYAEKLAAHRQVQTLQSLVQLSKFLFNSLY